MNIEKKEVILIWGAIIVVLYILTRLIYGFYMEVVFDYLSRLLGPSLTSALFWTGWILILIKAFDLIMKWCIFSDDI
jgi:hypothetical protein